MKRMNATHPLVCLCAGFTMLVVGCVEAEPTSPSSNEPATSESETDTTATDTMSLDPIDDPAATAEPGADLDTTATADPGTAVDAGADPGTVDIPDTTTDDPAAGADANP